MMRSARIAAIIALAALLCGQAPAPGKLADSFRSETMVIEASEYACHRFEIYLALDAAQQRRGLMFVRHLPELSGMLFVYREAGIRSMWMKNTYIPLDMLFIHADGSVSSVVTDTEPLSLESVTSIEPVHFVLELNAGVSGRLHIDTRSRLVLDRPGS